MLKKFSRTEGRMKREPSQRLQEADLLGMATRGTAFARSHADYGKQMRLGDGSKGLVGVEKDRDGAFVHQLNGHHSLKNFGGDGNAEVSQRFTKRFVESFSLVGWSGGDEAGAVAFGGIAMRSELWNEQ